MAATGTALRIGDPAPDFALADSLTGGVTSLDSLLDGHGGALLGFHRGMWCPNCRGQLRELRDSASRFEAGGISIAVVLPQRCDRIAGALDRHELTLPFPLLCDPDRAVVKLYGVWHPIGIASFNTAHPACFLIDSASRRIRYAFMGRSQSERVPLGAILALLQ